AKRAQHEAEIINVKNYYEEAKKVLNINEEDFSKHTELVQKTGGELYKKAIVELDKLSTPRFYGSAPDKVYLQENGISTIGLSDDEVFKLSRKIQLEDYVFNLDRKLEVPHPNISPMLTNVNWHSLNPNYKDFKPQIVRQKDTNEKLNNYV